MRLERFWRWGLLIVFLVGFSNGIWWMRHLPQRWYEGQDSHEYRLLAQNLVQGHGFSRDSEPPYRPALFREPGYSTFLAAIFALTGSNDEVVAVVQSGLLGLSAVLASILGYAVFGDRRIALLGGIWTGLSPDLGDHSRYEMTEAVFVPVLLLAVLVTMRAWKTASVRWGLAAGLVFGVATYIRVMAVPANVLLALGSLVLARGRPQQWRWAAASMGVMLLMMVPWIARNALETGHAAFTGRGGGFVMPRGDKAAAPFERQLQYLGIAAWVATYPVSELVVPFSRLHTRYVWDGPLGGYALLDTTAAFRRYCRGMGDVTLTDRCQMGEGIRMILSHPLQYLMLTPVEFARLTFYAYPCRLMLVRNWTVWLGIVTLAVCLLSASRRTPERMWLALVIAAYTLPSIAGDTQDRYGVPLVPFYSLFAAAGVVFVGDAIARRRGRRTSGTARVEVRPAEHA